MKLTEFLSIFEFSYEITEDNKIRLIDWQGANLGEIEEERFEINDDTVTNIIERMGIYIDDYIIIEFEDALYDLGIDYCDMTLEEMIQKCKENNVEDVSYYAAEILLEPSKIVIDKLEKTKDFSNIIDENPKTYDYKWIDFLCNHNVVKVTNEREFSEFKEFLRLHKLEGILNETTAFCDWQHLAKINNMRQDLFLFEYANHKGLTWGDDIQKSIDWYGEKPLKTNELFDTFNKQIDKEFDKEY